MILQGTIGPDVLEGTSEADELFGLEGNDLLLAGGGNDKLNGDDGDDTLDGGGGNDTLDGGEGNDTALYEDSTVSIAAELEPSGGYGYYSGYSGRDGSVSFPGRNWRSETLRSIENIHTGSGDDTIRGTSGDNILRSGDGSDLLVGGLGDDTLDGGRGNDTAALYWESLLVDSYGDGYNQYLDASARVSAYLNDGDGNLFLYSLDPSSGYDGTSIRHQQTLLSIENISTGFGDDNLRGDDNSNILSGGAGDDYLDGGRSGDTLIGGAGDDTLVGGGGRDRLEGGEGLDIADYRDTSANIEADLTAASVRFPDRNWRAESLTSIEGVIGGGGDDTLLGSSGDNYLAGFDGDDLLKGGKGDDSLHGGNGDDSLLGGGGSDTADYSSVGNDLTIKISLQKADLHDWSGDLIDSDHLQSIENATGGSGNDTLVGDSSANVLDGGGGSDILRGRGGDDVLVLSQGEDTLNGGGGTDTLRIDQMSLILDGATYNNFGHIYGGSASVTTRYESDVLVDLSVGVAKGGGGYWENSSVRNIENVELIGAIGDDTVIGSKADNVIDVGDGSNFVKGLGGNDLILGADDEPETVVTAGLYGRYGSGQTFEFSSWAPDERLYGNGGDDTITGSDFMSGGSGDDRLVSGTYRQEVEMRGGAGADEFVFAGINKIYDGHRPSESAMQGRILDFNSRDGDRLVIQGYWTSGSDYTGPTFVDERTNLKFNEYGFSRDGDDVVFRYKNAYYGSFDLTVRFVNYNGSLGQNDVIFV